MGREIRAACEAPVDVRGLSHRYRCFTSPLRPSKGKAPSKLMFIDLSSRSGCSTDAFRDYENTILR